MSSEANTPARSIETPGGIRAPGVPQLGKHRACDGTARLRGRLVACARSDNAAAAAWCRDGRRGGRGVSEESLQPEPQFAANRPKLLQNFGAKSFLNPGVGSSAGRPSARCRLSRPACGRAARQGTDVAAPRVPSEPCAPRGRAAARELARSGNFFWLASTAYGAMWKPRNVSRENRLCDFLQCKARHARQTG